MPHFLIYGGTSDSQAQTRDLAYRLLISHAYITGSATHMHDRWGGGSEGPLFVIHMIDLQYV